MLRTIIASLFHGLFIRKAIYSNLKRGSMVDIKTINSRKLVLLNDILNHAYLNVPYYKEKLNISELLNNGTLVLRDFEDIKKIPILTKDIIRREKENLYSDDNKKRNSFFNTSGGSTGEPVLFLQDKFFWENAQANFFLSKYLKNVSPFQSSIYFWGASRDLKAYDSFKGKMYFYLANSKKFDSSIISSKTILNFVDFINETRPKIIIAYVQSILEAAKYIEKNDINVIKQNVIHTGAGILTDEMRSIIERVFKCPVINHYGSREVGSIASECHKKNGLHIFNDFNFVEILNEQGDECLPDEEGEIYVTTLQNFSMPLIRYKIGDKGIRMKYEPCECGCNYEKIAKVTGRTNQNLINCKGEKVSGEFLTLTFNYTKGVEMFQIIQKSCNSIEIKLKVSEDYDYLNEKIIRQKMLDLFGNDSIIEFDYSGQMLATPTGKHLYIINKI